METIFTQGMIAATVAGLITGVGGFIIFLKKRYSQENINFLLNIAAGVMLAAAFFSLLSPSMNQIIKFHSNIQVAALWYTGAVFSGVALVWVLNELLPHEHNNMGHHGMHFSLKTAWLFIIAITLHKIPEGLAVGVAYSAENFMDDFAISASTVTQKIGQDMLDELLASSPFYIGTRKNKTDNDEDV